MPIKKLLKHEIFVSFYSNYSELLCALYPITFLAPPWRRRTAAIEIAAALLVYTVRTYVPNKFSASSIVASSYDALLAFIYS